MQKTIVITSGYFNPLHPGHIECFDLCRALGDKLWVIVNSDHQATLKTGSQELFQDEEYRIKVVSALKAVDHIMLSVDNDGSVCESIRKIHALIIQQYGDNVKVIFGKGGDRFTDNIPELQVCKELCITVRDGLGAKIDNSSVYRAKRV